MFLWSRRRIIDSLMRMVLQSAQFLQLYLKWINIIQIFQSEKALDNFKLYIADKFGHLLPYGACGELMISGWQVSRGYLNKPEKTSEVYTKNILTMQKAMKSCIIQVMWQDFFQMEISRSLEEKDSQVKVRGFGSNFLKSKEVIRRYEGIKGCNSGF